jgi:hypothetical protein
VKREAKKAKVTVPQFIRELVEAGLATHRKAKVSK